jgi:SAM-dependent methyltransferase
MSALDRWRDELRAWTIPDAILSAAPESPYGFPTEPFRRRAERAIERAPTPTTLRAGEALPRGGTVLDVGVGSGATSLPLAAQASRITGVDGSETMLETFGTAARNAGVEAVGVLGSWPAAAREVEAADVVVCGHVLYNVQDLRPFVVELTDHARHRCVVELTDRHPWAWMHELWQRFHGLERPDGPTADDAEAALRELRLEVGREDRVEPGIGGFERREDAVGLVRRRLCLPAARDDEVADALGNLLAEHDGLWSAGPQAQPITTMWWEGTASAGA